MNYRLFILTPILACSVCKRLDAQTIMQGASTGIKGTTSFEAAIAFEKAHPEKIIRKKRPPNQTAQKPKEKINFQNKVDDFVAPFSGKTTVVKDEMLQGPETRTQEFPCNNFRALDDDGSSFPPDVNGAVGFNHLMTTLNTQVRIQSKQGVEERTVSLTGFWNGLGGHVDVFDPKITYDPYDKRWFFVACATRQAAGSALLLGVSQTSDPNDGWITYTIDADPADLYWFDYPSLGFNRNWITVGGYMFDIPGQVNTQRSRVWAINKAVVYAGNPNITVTFFDRTDVFHISPAVTYSATDNTQWLVSTWNNNSNNSGFYRMYSITGTQAAPVFNVGNTINVGGAWAPAGVNGPQQTSGIGLDLGDNRMLQSTFRNNTLWVGNNVFLPATNPTTCAAQVVAINTTNSTAIETIRTAANTNGSVMQAYPSISVNRNNEIFFGYSTFRNNAFVASTVGYRRNDGLGFFFYYYKAGEDWYVQTDNNGLNRWGDYSATFIDPEDDVSAWTVQQYARPRVAGNSFWGTWWAKICPGSCAGDLSYGAPYNSIMGKYESTGTITSTAQVLTNSFIKYDAAVRVRLLPGFKVVAGNRFQAYIEGCGGVR